MSEVDTFRQKLEAAFGNVKFPGVSKLVDSESREAQATALAFRDFTDWRQLDADFLNSAPDGLGSALNFFSAEAFRFFLPAFLLADVAGKLPFVEPDFSLCYRYSASWEHGDEFEDRNTIFTASQCNVIVDYLKLRLKRCDDPMIEKALSDYWIRRCDGKLTKGNGDQ